MNNRTRWIDRLIPGKALTLAAMLPFALSTATYAAGLLVADGGLGGVLEIEEHSVNVTINNGVAVTDVTQVFHNTEQRQVEALYMFPVPKGASVANFSMWINGKEMVGEVLEKQRAREIYNSYKQVRKDPGLLEQTDYRTFEMRIFPIGPGAQQKVQITYYQELDFDHDWATYVYPLATVARSGVDARAKGKMALTLNAKSEVPIAAMESSSHPGDFVIVKRADTYYQASMEMAGGDLNKDIVIAYHLSRPVTGLDMITSRTGGEDGYFCMTLTAGEELAQPAKGMDYVFILDISGSMADGGKLALSRGSVGAFINALGDEDRFEVVTFNVQPNALFRQLAGGNDQAKKKAAEFLGSQRPAGGTVLEPALSTAYKYRDAARPLNVVVLSDGLTEQAEARVLVQMIRSRPENVRVFCIGVGNDVNRPLLEQLAGDSGGLAAFISAGDSFDRQAQAFRRKLTRPVASDLNITFDGANVYDVEPKALPNLYHGTPVRLYGRYKGEGAVKAIVKAQVDGKELNMPFEINFPAVDAGNPEIERMWAWHKAQRLLKQADAEGSRSTAVLSEIINLGETYSIATEYTSFLVLENDAEYKRWKIERRNASRVERDRRPRQQLQAQLEKIRSKALSDLGPEPLATPPQAGAPSSPAQQQQIVQNTPATGARQRGWNVDFRPNGGRGSGAIDPITLGMAAVLAGTALLAGRGRAVRK